MDTLHAGGGECGPPGLVAGSDTSAGIAIEELTEEDEITPVWVVNIARLFSV
jgi:hypothetical protein